MDDVRFQGTGMEKENSASGGGGGGGGGGGAEAAAAATPGATSTSEKLQADQANPLLDPTALFGGKSFSLVSLLSFSVFPSLVFSPRSFSPPSASPSHQLARMRRDKRRRYAKRYDQEREGGGNNLEKGSATYVHRPSILFTE